MLGKAQVWDLATGKQLAQWEPTPREEGEFHSEFLWSFGCHVAFSPNGKWLATGTGHAKMEGLDGSRTVSNGRKRPVQLYEVAGFKEHAPRAPLRMDFNGVPVLPCLKPTERGAVGFVGFTADSQVLAAVEFAGERSRLHLGEVATGKLLGVKDVGEVDEVMMSVDGKRVVLGCGDTVKFVDPQTGVIRETFPGPQEKMGVRFALSPKGGWLAMASYNGETVQIRQLPPSGK
jgi:hypothetical protein